MLDARMTSHTTCLLVLLMVIVMSVTTTALDSAVCTFLRVCTTIIVLGLAILVMKAYELYNSYTLPSLPVFSKYLEMGTRSLRTVSNLISECLVSKKTYNCLFKVAWEEATIETPLGTFSVLNHDNPEIIQTELVGSNQGYVELNTNAQKGKHIERVVIRDNHVR